MIQVQNISLSLSSKPLFEEANFLLSAGNRYGLVGANGSGKTSFCKLITGELTPSEGKIQIPNDCRIGVLLQNHYGFEQEKIVNVVLQGKPELWKAVSRKEEILAKGDDLTEKDGEELADLEVVLADQDAYRAEAGAEIILEGLGIPAARISSPMSVLSGGYKIRVLLARVLFSEPDLLILDEPNNHLDLESILWLEKYLMDFRGLVLMISHDHHLINRVSTHILDVDYQRIKLYKGNYEQFQKQKAEAEELKTKEIEKQEKKKEELERFVERFSAKATKARQANSKKKAIDKMEIETIVRSSRIAPKFKFEMKRPSGRDVVGVKNLSKSYGEKKILNDLSFQVERGKRLAVLGYNGAGKSTLLKIMADQLQPDAGEVEWGYEVYAGYFAQNQRDLVRDTDTPYDWLYQIAPSETISAIRSVLGLMLFSDDEVHKKAKALSGGELSRLIFARLIYEKNNVLILDEPTNHLDLETIEALIAALKKFPGTLIFVSHDEYFISELADSILYFPGENLPAIEVDNGYKEFKTLYLEAKPEKEKSKPKSDNHFKKQKSERNAKKKIQQWNRENERLEKSIQDLESEQTKIESRLEQQFAAGKMNDPETEELCHRQQTIAESIEARFAEWEKLQTKMKQFNDLPGNANT